MSRGAASATRAMTLPIGGSSSSSLSSSSLDDWCEFHEHVREANEARQRYSDATREVSQLERCLDTIRVALKALEMEIAAT
jgi:hypothetical protein